jgi:hypothetical protein
MTPEETPKTCKTFSLTEDERKFLHRLVIQEIKRAERDQQRYKEKHGKPFTPAEGKKDITIYKIECGVGLIKKLDENPEGKPNA